MTAASFRLTLAGAACVLLLAACSGDDGSAGDDPGAATTPTAASSTTSAPTATVATTSGGDETAGGDIDVCALVPGGEVEAVIGMPVGPAQRDDFEDLFYGCRYEEEALTQVVTLGVIAYEDAEEAEDSFEFGADQYPAVDGIGDRAYNSQPIDDITVLAGRYEVSVGLYFVADDDDTEHAMARELATLLLDRLP